MQSRPRFAALPLALLIAWLNICGQQPAQHMAPVIEKREAPAEIKVPANLSQYASVMASSEFAPRFSAWRATDGTSILIDGGKRENCWGSMPGTPSKGQWFQLSFSRPERIDKVSVWYRVILGHHRFVPKTVTIQVSDDAEGWRTVLSRSGNVPASGAKADRTPREYACGGIRAQHLRLLFENGAQPDERYDLIELVEVIVPPPPGWTPPEMKGAAAVEVQGSKTLPLVLPGELPLKIREDVRDGRTTLVYEDADFTIRLPHGVIGTQAPTVLPTFPAGHFDDMLKADADIWGERVLSDPQDPSFETVAGFAHPYKFPYCHAGTPEGKQEIAVAWDGSVSQAENGYYMRFGFGKHGIPKSNAYDVRRGLPDGSIPAPVMVYVDRERRLGWQQTVVCEEIEGRFYTYVKLRLRNWGDRETTDEFSIFPFVHQKRDVAKTLTPANLRMDGKLAYVGSGLSRIGFHLSTAPAVGADRLFYTVSLAPGEQWQLVVKLNGYHARGGDEKAFTEKVVPRSIYAALRDQK
ncbi:MAG: discoidin domain-containing protein, partial [Lentisphaeria bacterium]|nr:discoidin domain-containing protein [Lentisphaeria bacterium]